MCQWLDIELTNVQNCLSIFINYWLVLYPLYPNDIPIQWSGTCDSFGSLKKRLFFLVGQKTGASQDLAIFRRFNL